MRLQTSHRGFTLVEIMIVVAIIGLLAAVAVPNFLKARTTSQKNTCIANLRLVDSTVQQWALENKKASTDTYSLSDTALIGYFKGSALPYCPGVCPPLLSRGRQLHSWSGGIARAHV